MRPLATIGYEGKTLEEVLGALKKGRIEIVIDVRAVASSRRPGFSKTALAGALGEQGIDYLHLRALGTPAPGREAARKGRIDEMRAICTKELKGIEASQALARAVNEAGSRRAVLLCYEADAACCHRSVIAEHMELVAPFERADL